MNSEMLLTQFDRLIDTPDAIASLRQFILDLAVRGKLVKQDPHDEPAAELLERIRREKAQWLKEGKIRTPREMQVSADDSQLFQLPATWIWCCLSDVGAIVGGGTPPSGDLDNFEAGGSGIAWLTPADLGKHNSPYVSHGDRDLTEKGLRSSSAILIPKGSVLFTSRAPIGYTAIAANELSTNQGFKSVVPFIMECNLYIAVYFRAFGKTIDDKASGTTFREVSGRVVASLPFPLPPIAEQRRIVAKIEELLALCDRLEVERAEREDTRARLVAASHRALQKGVLPAPGLDEHFGPVARFFLQNIPRLVTSPMHVSEMRQTILNLAVRGMLVALDVEFSPTDLLETIKTERLQLRSTTSDLAKTAAEFDKLALEYRTVGTSKPPFISMRCACHFITKGTTPGPESLRRTGDIPFLKVYNIVNNALDFDYKPTFIPRSVHDNELRRSKVYPGDVLMNIVGPPLGKVAVVTNQYPEWNVNQAIAVFRPLSSFDSRFLMIALACQATIGGVLKETRGVVGQDNLSLEQVRSIRIPLLPLSHQQRVVLKVEELMSLCDRLETQLAAAATQGTELLEALLSSSLTDNNKAELDSDIRKQPALQSA